MYSIMLCNCDITYHLLIFPFTFWSREAIVAGFCSNTSAACNHKTNVKFICRLGYKKYTSWCLFIKKSNFFLHEIVARRVVLNRGLYCACLQSKDCNWFWILKVVKWSFLRIKSTGLTFLIWFKSFQFSDFHTSHDIWLRLVGRVDDEFLIFSLEE